ncbi:hypothetical protein [Nostoc sp.]|uniref:hypothetical protein n=1 Tax=Nostoc sp. TaxID=1180 RepID=UPI003593B157
MRNKDGYPWSTPGAFHLGAECRDGLRPAKGDRVLDMEARKQSRSSELSANTSK